MRILAQNDRARFDYNILESFEAGLVLSGHEVKAAKRGKISIKGSYVQFLNLKPLLLGSIISPYQSGNVPQDYDPQRSRTLLLNNKEIKYLVTKSNEQGLTIVPLKVYEKDNYIKIEIALARGKTKYDKREAIKKREFKKQASSYLKNGNSLR